jgi:hypothetical protein
MAASDDANRAREHGFPSDDTVIIASEPIKARDATHCKKHLTISPKRSPDARKKKKRTGNCFANSPSWM